MANMNLSEREFEAFRFGDRHSFEKVYEEYQHAVYVYCFKMLGGTADAQDAVAETMAKLWDRRDTINSRQHMHSYLYKVAQHKCIDLLRKRKSQRTSFTIDQLSDVLPSEDTDVYDRLEAAVEARLLERIHKEINELAPRRKKVIYLNMVKSLAIEKVAKLLHMTRKTAYNHRNLAITDIRIALKKKVTKGMSFKDLL